MVQNDAEHLIYSIHSACSCLCNLVDYGKIRKKSLKNTITVFHSFVCRKEKNIGISRDSYRNSARFG